MTSGSCCSAVDDTGQCLKSTEGCTARFLSNIFPICCPEGQSYDITAKKCSGDCNGIVALGVFCIPVGGVLSIQQNSASLLPDRMCNGVMLPSDMTVCCPVGFFASGTKGCIGCSGRIFGNTDSQVCCRIDEIYSPSTGKCNRCDGPIDSYGLLCCGVGQFVSYNTDGSRSCQATCPLEFIQNGSYCCKICNGTTNQCTANKVSCGAPKGCSPSYFVPNNCQPCGCGNCLTNDFTNYCGDCQTAAVTRLSSCNPTCPPRSVYDPNTKICLDCDESCESCHSSIDPSGCIDCKKGYSKSGGSCQPCEGSCLECQGSSCTACHRLGMLPVFMSGRCMPSCRVGTYIDINATCSACDPGCFTCRSYSPDSCMSCYNGSYIPAMSQNGRCMTCSPSCKNCEVIAENCTECLDGTSLWNGTCVAQCPATACVKKYSQQSICVACHPKCQGCTNLPTNCVACQSGSYLDNSTGFNACVECPVGCPVCTSKTSCATCNDGFYKSDSGCLKCDPSCATCNSGLSNGCLTCAPGLQLSNGNCIGCLSACLTCSSPTTCSSCPAGKSIVNGSCVDKCPDKTFQKASQCKPCDKTCQTCSNQSDTACITCSDASPYRDQGKCVIACNKTAFIYNRACINCNGTVYMLSTLCCQFPKILINGQCISNQPVPPIPPNPNPNPKPNPNPNPNPNNGSNNRTTPNNTYNNGSVVTPRLKVHCILQGKQIYVTVVSPNQTAIDKKRLSLVLLQEATKRLLIPSATALNYTVAQEGSDYLILKMDSPPVSNSKIVLKVEYPPDLPVYSPELASQYTLATTYQQDVGLKAIGIICSIILLIYAVACKCKSHYEAQEANRIVLHALHFCQMVAMFYIMYISPDGALFNFYKGFRFCHFSWWFNMFAGTLPPDYVEPYQPATLIPDGNLTRNAGFTFSFWIILILLLGIAIGVIYLLFYCNESYPQPPGLRLTLRLFILFMGLTFINVTFFSIVELTYHSRDGYYPHQGIYDANFAGSIVVIFLIPLMIAGSYVHNHFTYFSDDLEHLYSLRECSQLMLNFFQAVVLAVSINSYYTVLVLVLELIWFGWNILLYPAGHWTENLKHYITEAAVIIGYIFLIVGSLASIATIVVVTVVMIVLIVYSSYQVVGLYYWNIMDLFGIEQEEEEVITQ